MWVISGSTEISKPDTVHENTLSKLSWMATERTAGYPIMGFRAWNIIVGQKKASGGSIWTSPRFGECNQCGRCMTWVWIASSDSRETRRCDTITPLLYLQNQVEINFQRIGFFDKDWCLLSQCIWILDCRRFNALDSSTRRRKWAWLFRARRKSRMRQSAKQMLHSCTFPHVSNVVEHCDDFEVRTT